MTISIGIKGGGDMTPKEVEARFEEAAETLRKMRTLTSRDVPQQLRSTHPDIVRSFHEAYGYNEINVRLPLPDRQEITRLDEVIEWTRSPEITDQQRKILWARAFNVRWKIIAVKNRCGRTKAYHIWREAIIKIIFITTGCVFEQNSSEHFEHIQI